MDADLGERPRPRFRQYTVAPAGLVGAMVLALGVQSAPTAIVLALLVSASRSTPHGESVVPMNCHRNDNDAPGHTSRGRHSSRPVQHRG